MNNEQNNANNTGTPVTPITPITPIQPQVVDGSDAIATPTPPTATENLTSVNMVAAPVSDDKKIDVVNPIPPSNSNGGSTLLMPNISMPEVKGSESSMNINSTTSSSVSSTSNPVGNSSSNANGSPQLNLESSSPFDIGVTPPLNTGVSTSVPVQGDIKPISVTGGTSNSNTVSSDIKINNGMIVGANTGEPSVGTYLLYMFLFTIPLIGFIVLLLKAFDKNSNISNYAKAQLILVVIGFVLGLLMFFILGPGAFTLR